MIAAVYLLCALTSTACAGLLLRGWFVSRARLLLWSSVGFACFALNNILVVVDRLVVPDVDLRVLRTAPAAVGVTALLIGCIWDAD